ncbi:hypothetical protein MAR_021081, partial [Mya arenaria]
MQDLIRIVDSRSIQYLNEKHSKNCDYDVDNDGFSDDLLEISSVYAKSHGNSTTLCITRESTLQFLPEDNEITIDPEDGATFANDGVFIHENENVKITIPEFCRNVELKASLKECVHYAALTCRTEVMFKTNDGPLKKAVPFKQELEKMIDQKLQGIDEDDI